MPKLLILIGVPGSGKSTWAEKTLSHQCKIVSPDYIRAELGDIADQSKNAEVWKIAYDRVIDNLSAGKDVILDATHATKRTREKSIEVGMYAEAEIVGVYFPIDDELAKERNKRRDRVVPEHVIDRMAASLAKEPPSKDEGFHHFWEI